MMNNLLRTSRWILLVMLGLIALSACAASTSAATMSVNELKAQLDAEAPLFLLDVRTPQEFAQDGRISQATLIPLQELPSRLNELPTDTPIACICRSGNRSASACEILAERGYQVTDVAGGMLAWQAAGYPIE